MVIRFPTDQQTWSNGRQFMWGDALLISPVITEVIVVMLTVVAMVMDNVENFLSINYLLFIECDQCYCILPSSQMVRL